MNAEQYIRSQLDGTFMKWLGPASYESVVSFPFKAYKVPVDFQPPYCKRREEGGTIAVKPPTPKLREGKPRKPSGGRARREFNTFERAWIDGWLKDGVSHMEIVARLRCGRDIFQRYVRELRSK